MYYLSYAHIGIPANNIKHKYEVIIFEVRQVCSQKIGFHFQLNILQNTNKLWYT